MGNGMLFQKPLKVNNPCPISDDSEVTAFNKVLFHFRLYIISY